MFSEKICLYPSINLVDSTENSNIEWPQIYLSEFLRFLKISELPSSKLKLKLGVPIILLWNLNLLEELYNKTRLICHRF